MSMLGRGKKRNRPSGAPIRPLNGLIIASDEVLGEIGVGSHSRLPTRDQILERMTELSSILHKDPRNRASFRELEQLSHQLEGLDFNFTPGSPEIGN